MKTSLFAWVVSGLMWINLGCGASVSQQVDHSPQTFILQRDESQHLYLIALQPQGAFKTAEERAELWSALRGDNPDIRPLLGPIEQIPLDYRVEYVFNHGDPANPETEYRRLLAWTKRLTPAAVAKAKSAKTLLLVKGTLKRLPQAQDVRLTMAALVFIAEKYDGVILDLLNRRAHTPSELREALLANDRLETQVRIIGAREGDQRGIRSVGLPKYGYPDLFLATVSPREDAIFLASVVDGLLKISPMPGGIALRPCRTTDYDFGCYEIHRDSYPSR